MSRGEPGEHGYGRWRRDRKEGRSGEEAKGSESRSIRMRQPPATSKNADE